MGMIYIRGRYGILWIGGNIGVGYGILWVKYFEVYVKFDGILLCDEFFFMMYLYKEDFKWDNCGVMEVKVFVYMVVEGVLLCDVFFFMM